MCEIQLGREVEGLKNDLERCSVATRLLKKTTKRGAKNHLRFFARVYTIKSWAVFLADESSRNVLSITSVDLFIPWVVGGKW